MAVIDSLIVKNGSEFLPIDSYDNQIIDEINYEGNAYHFAKQRDIEGETQVVADNSVDEPIISLAVEGNTFQQTYAGKNLALATQVYPNATKITVDGRECIKNAGNKGFAFRLTGGFKENTQYTVSFDVSVKRNTNASQGLSPMVFFVKYKDTATDWARDAIQTNSEEFTHKVKTTLANKTIDYIGAYYNTDSYDAYIDINTFMFQEGAIADPVYEPYVGGIPSPNPGHVLGTPASPIINAVTSDITDNGWTDGGESTIYIVSSTHPVYLPQSDKTYRVWVDENEFRNAVGDRTVEIYIGTSIKQVTGGSDSEGTAQSLAVYNPNYGTEYYEVREMSQDFYIGIGNTYDGIPYLEEDLYWHLLDNIPIYIQTEPYESTLVKIPAYPQPILNANDSRLPNEYQEVQYIESTGTQYIDTGFIPTENTEILMDFEFIQKGRVFGANSNSIIATYSSSGTGISFQFGNSTSTLLSFSEDKRYELQYDKNGVFVDGVAKLSFAYSEFNANETLVLCNTNAGTSGTLAKLKIYSFKISNNGTLVRDFVPCYRKSDNVVGIYDLVNGVFYTNSGTGEFVKGANVGMSLELRGANLFNRPDVTMATNNEYYKNLSSGGFVLQPSTTYTVSFDYEFISVNEAGKPYWSIGRGAGGYATDITYKSPFPNFTKGRAYDTFTTPSNLGTSNKLFFRVPRGDARITCEVKLSNFMLNYGEQSLPFEPYFAPTTIAIPPSVTVGSSTIPLRFAKVEDKADYIEVNRLDGTVKYVRNIAYGKLTKADSTYTYQNTLGIYTLNFAEQVMTRPKGICTHSNSVGNIWDVKLRPIWVGVNTTVLHWVGILDTLGFTTKEEFNNWLDEQEAQGTPVEIIYERKSPVTTDITNTELGQELLALATHKGTNTFTISSEIPVSKTALSYWRQIIPNE